MANRKLEALFIPNNLAITDVEIFGALQSGNELTFTVSTVGENISYQWEFIIYKNNELCYSNNSTINFFEWTPTESGNYSILVNVIDSSNFKVSYTQNFNVT